MTKPKIFAGLALAGMLLSTSALSPIGPLAVAPAQAQSASVSFNLFFDELEPHGVWVRHPEYRYVFCPTGVDTRWRPYTRGRWLYLADTGWYFDSDEPFAWATYHYGRWFDDDNLGWCWVPGTKWAPAWVSWRRGGDAIGWAPLPPQGSGFSLSVDVVREDFPEEYWVFVPTRSFIEPNLSVSIVFGSDARSYYEDTEFLGPVVVQGDVVTNNVIEVNYIEQQINQEVTVYNVEQAGDPAAATVTGDQTVQIFNQDVAEPTEEVAPAQAVEESEASALIASEGGTAGAEDATEATESSEEAGETETTDAESDVDAATEADAEAEADTAADVNADATDVEEPAATTEEATEAQQPAATDEDASAEADAEAEAEQPAATEEEATQPEADADEQTEDAAPAATDDESATEAEPAMEASDAAEEEATEETSAPAEDAEASAPAEEGAASADCPPELLVGGVCQTAGAEASEADSVSDGSNASPSGADESSEESVEEPAAQ